MINRTINLDDFSSSNPVMHIETTTTHITPGDEHDIIAGQYIDRPIHVETVKYDIIPEDYRHAKAHIDFMKELTRPFEQIVTREGNTLEHITTNGLEYWGG